MKDLLPAYLEQGLDSAARNAVEKHLEGCPDCRSELVLLRMMFEEPVPDPGEAFWAAMPARVQREVRQQQDSRGSEKRFRFWDRILVRPWIAASAAAALVLMISLFALRFPGTQPAPPLTEGYDAAVEVASAGSDDAVYLSEFTDEELIAVEDWAGGQLASHSPAIELFLLNNGGDTDLYEELAQLNAEEIERLSRRITRWEQEG